MGKTRYNTLKEREKKRRATMIHFMQGIVFPAGRILIRNDTFVICFIQRREKPVFKCHVFK